MYFWNSYPFIRFSIALIAGILTFDVFQSIWDDHFLFIGSGVVLLLFSLLLSKQTSYYQLRHINGLIGLLIIFILGGSFTKLKYHSHPPHHYSKIGVPAIGYTGKIISPVNERANHFRYDFELESLITTDSFVATQGKIHLYIKKDSSQILEYGDQMVVTGRIFEVPGPDNPAEFDYQSYLRRQNIFSHSFIKSTDFKKIANDPPNRFLKFAYKVRKSASDILDLHIPQPRENGIAKALLLGIKDHLDNDIKKSYSAAGAMHVLAVSGLHVGIVYLLIQLLLGKLRSYGKWGRYTFGLVSVLVIWSYATLTGLSPSVLRAATMFSFVAVSKSTAREGNIYNTLGFSAFILLLPNPYLIYSVGFQLSFAAVFGIVYLQPKIYRLLHFPNKLLDKAWAITCVSIAAQLATFPLSAFYFHQFPTYFLVSNLLVIPASSIILVGGLALFIASPIWNSLGVLIGKALYSFMWVLNELIISVHSLPSSLLEWIYMDKVGLILTYLIVISLIAGLHFRSYKTLIISAFIGLAFILFTLWSHETQYHKEELIFYEIGNKTAIDHIHGHSAKLYVDEINEDDLELLAFQIDPYRLLSRLKSIKSSVHKLELIGSKSDALKFGVVGPKRLLFFDSTTFHLDFKDRIATNLIVINNESVKSLKWLIEHFTFDQIILNNQNSNYYIKKMKNEADRLGIDLHSLKSDGALRIPLDIKKERTIVPALFTTNPD